MTFENIDLGYSKDRLDKLKNDSDKMNKVIASLGVIGVAAIGCLVFNKNPFKLLKMWPNAWDFLSSIYFFFI